MNMRKEATFANACMRCSKQWRTVAAAGLLLPGIAGCQPTPPAPELNPNPKHVVRITGRIPASLEVSLGAGYGPSDISGECKPRMLVEGFLALDPDDYHRGQKLEIRRDGERFETSFVVDKYLPGKCGWQFEGIGGSVLKDGNEGDRKRLQTRVAIGHLGTSEPYCTNTSGPSCPITENSDPTPAIVRCEMFNRGRPGDEPKLMCQPYELFKYKRTHIVTDDTTAFEVNFHDLAVEPDPISDKQKEETNEWR